MKTTIDIAREAGGRAQQNKNCDVEYLMSAGALKAFEAFVRADEREQALAAPVCSWGQVDDLHTPDTWEAECGAMWTFTEGGPKDNNMRFCPECGKPLQQKGGEK